MLRQAQSIFRKATVICVSLTLCVFAFLIGCGQSTWSDRDSAIVEGIRIDSLIFSPAGGRFILRDSASAILFKGYHKGYSCSEILEMDLTKIMSGGLPAYGPKSRVRLPAQPDCPLEKSGQNIEVSHTFGHDDDSIIRLLNSAGTITDSAKLVRGVFSIDSIGGVVGGIARTYSQGRWTYLDSTSTTPRRLFADSLSSCEFLNAVTYALEKDTVRVHISWVTLDMAASPDSCLGDMHQQEILLDPSIH